MKVLQINSVCGIRSTGRICTDIAEVLEKEGNECKIAYGRETVPEKYQKYAIRIGSDFSNKVDAIKTRIFDNAGFNSSKETKRFLNWVKGYDPDIIHLHNIHGYYINIELLFEYLKESNKPVVWTLHDCWPFTGHCAYYDYFGCEKWKTQCCNCEQTKEYPSAIFKDMSRKNHNKKTAFFSAVDTLQFVAISNWIALQKEQSLLKSKPHTIIHNGIDLIRFQPTISTFRQKWRIVDKRVYLGVASVWDRRKGFDTFLKLSEMIDENEVIVMVGVTKEQKKLLPKNIIGIERTNNVQELSEIYSAADVFLNPTMEDNYPTVNMEAIACGTPVVTYDTGGSPESISKSSGAVVPKGDIMALLKTARSLELDSEKVALEAQKFDKERKYKEYLQFYARCLK
ncbi:MAG: glycosyltransferase [Ruminococcaceae bacterium]|nr:glycosyltransferase [Oscillospiraceae bacterium]